MRKFAGYAIIGAIGVALYLGVLWLLLRLGLGRFGAVTVAFVLAIAVQFTLNRWVNFKDLDRPVHRQAPMYLLTAGVNYLLTLGTMALSIHFWHVSVFAANILAVMVTLPVGFFGTRYLTFGKVFAPSGFNRVFGRAPPSRREALHSRFEDER